MNVFIYYIDLIIALFSYAFAVLILSLSYNKILNENAESDSSWSLQ